MNRKEQKGFEAKLGGDAVALKTAKDLSGVVFGKQGGKYATMPETTDGHVLIVGGAGSGKTAAVAIPTLMSWKERVFAIDIKGELYAKTKKARGEAQIKVFNPTDTTAYGYDPFYMLKNADDISSAARQLAMSIVPLPADVKDPFWIKGAQNMLTGFLIYFQGLGESFSSTMKYIKSIPTKELIEQIVADTNEKAKMEIMQFSGMDDKTLSGVYAELSNHITVFATSDDLQRALSGEGACITPADLESGYDIYCCIPEHKLDEWKDLLGMMCNQFLKSFERRAEGNTTPILFLIDEFPRLGKIEAISNGLATLRSKKIHISLIVQSKSQLNEEIAKIEEQIPKAAGNEKVLLSVQAGLLKLYDKAKLIEPTKTSEGRTIEIDGRKVPYFEYHKNKLVGDISFAQDKVKGYLDMLAQQRQEAPQEQGGFAARREVFKQQEAPQEKPKIDTAYVERMAQQLATVRNEFVRETVNSHERTRYQPNPIYARQANEIESVAKTVAEQSRTIEAFKAERDKLGMFKGKEKKEIQGKIDNFERLRRSNLDKLKALGVSNLSKADEAAKEKRTLAAQEQEKAQAARRNEGAGSRAEEAKQVFLEAAKRIPADQRQAVLERMEQYNSHEAGGMEVFKAEIEARRVLDSALKEQTQDREHEKTKVKGRGRTD